MSHVATLEVYQKQKCLSFIGDTLAYFALTQLGVLNCYLVLISEGAPGARERLQEVGAPQAQQLVVHRHAGRPAGLAARLGRLQAQQPCSCNDRQQLVRSDVGGSAGLAARHGRQPCSDNDIIGSPNHHGVLQVDDGGELAARLGRLKAQQQWSTDSLV